MPTILKAGNSTSGYSMTPGGDGQLSITTGSGAGTTALTINASQNTTLVGTLQVNGTLQAAGVTTNIYPIVSGTAQTAPFAVTTYADFTGIPSWAKRITVMFDDVSTSGTSVIAIQLGDAGGVETTGYFSTGQNVVSTGITHTSPTTALALGSAVSSTAAYSGVAYLSLLSSSTNTWVMTSGLTAGGATALTGYGSKSLSATLTRIRITAVNTTDTFDTGTVNIMWE
jgi:hypothetical protein